MNEQSTAQSMRGWYRRYLDCCNRHDFDRLDEFVAAEVHVNGERQGLAGYIAGLRAVVAAFPDYRWELRHLLVEGNWLAAHLHDTGTHLGMAFGSPATGRRVSTEEFAFYRIEGARIVEVWVTADDLQLLRQLGGPTGP